MFSVHIEIAMLASPVNHSVNLRTVNNMGLHITPSPLPEIRTRWRLRVRTKAIMAANSYKKMYGDKETCSNISIMSLRVFGARLETC